MQTNSSVQHGTALHSKDVHTIPHAHFRHGHPCFVQFKSKMITNTLRSATIRYSIAYVVSILSQHYVLENFHMNMATLLIVWVHFSIKPVLIETVCWHVLLYMNRSCRLDTYYRTYECTIFCIFSTAVRANFPTRMNENLYYNTIKQIRPNKRDKLRAMKRGLQIIAIIQTCISTIGSLCTNLNNAFRIETQFNLKSVRQLFNRSFIHLARSPEWYIIFEISAHRRRIPKVFRDNMTRRSLISLFFLLASGGISLEFSDASAENSAR